MPWLSWWRRVRSVNTQAKPATGGARDWHAQELRERYDAINRALDSYRFVHSALNESLRARDGAAQIPEQGPAREDVEGDSPRHQERQRLLDLYTTLVAGLEEHGSPARYVDYHQTLEIAFESSKNSLHSGISVDPEQSRRFRSILRGLRDGNLIRSEGDEKIVIGLLHQMEDGSAVGMEGALVPSLGLEGSDAVAHVAEETIEHAMARMFLRLGPPPESTELDYVPAGSDGGGAHQ